jgi:arylsulfatase A-like enzyme
VQHTDLLPTLLDYLEIEIPAAVEGQSLLALLGDGSVSLSPRSLLSYLHLSGPPRAMIIDGDWKLIERYPPGKPVQRWLYNLRDDPRELFNRAPENPRRAQRLGRLLADRLAEPKIGQAPAAEIDALLRQELEALGYLQ